MHTKLDLRKALFWALLTTTLLLTGCEAGGDAPAGAGAARPQVWVEYPLEGEVLPLESVPIVIYATDVGDGRSLQVTVNGQALAISELTALSSDGSSRLVRADLAWQPSEPGKYVVEASIGHVAASSAFCVGSCSPEEAMTTPLPPPEQLQPTPTPTYFAAPTEVIPTATPLPTPTPYTLANAEFWADPPEIESGECTVLRWKVYGNFQQVYFEGHPVDAEGSDQECPAESRTYYLQVLEMNGGYTDYWAEVTVSAPPPPSDTNGPDISNVDRVWESCNIYGQATVNDSSGIAWALFYYNLNDTGWQSISMSDLGGGFWQTDYPFSVDDGSGTPVGTFQYYVTAADTLGNESTSPVYSEDYFSCGGG